LLNSLPEGVAEMYFHPSTRRCTELDRAMPGYQNEREFEALISPAVRETVSAAGVQMIAFSEL
jgi:hypothetical protein